MPSFRMWRRVDLVTTEVSEERIASFFSVERMRQREKCLAFANRQTDSLTRFSLAYCFYLEDGGRRDRREYLKSYIVRHVRENACCALPSALKWTEPLTPIVTAWRWWFHHFIACGI
jgi:hypothetical protein